MKKAQSSLDFTLTFGIGFILILILSGIFIYYSGSAKQDLDKKQIEKVGNEIIFNAEKVFFLGDGNRLTLKVTLPIGIANFTIHHINNSNGTDTIEFDYLNISSYLDGNRVDNIFSPNQLYIRMNCTRCYNTENYSHYNSSDFGGGPKRIRIESKGDWVSIDFINE